MASQQTGGQSENGVTVVQQAHTIDSEVVLNSPTAGNGNSGDQASDGGDLVDNNSPQAVDATHYITVTGGAARSYASLTTVNPTVDPDGNTEEVTHSYVQYVEGTSEQTIYTTANGQMYPVYTVGDSGNLYTTTSGQYYHGGGSPPVTYAQVVAPGGAEITIAPPGGAPSGHPEGTAGDGTNVTAATAAYLIQGTATPEQRTDGSPNSVVQRVQSTSGGTTEDQVTAYLVEGQNGSGPNSLSDVDVVHQPNIAHATRVSPTTVQWLLENYETAEGVSLPRSMLYNHYLRHCYENKLDPVNAASFGKLIRSVFLGLRTRRLGTRGNSKYHYYGIRIKAGSMLNSTGQLDDGSVHSPSGAGSGRSSSKRYSSGNGNGSRISNVVKDEHGLPQLQTAANHEYLGDANNAIPDFPDIEITGNIPTHCTIDDLETFRNIYREHLEAFLDAIINLEFGTVESLWREFWRCQDNNNDECEEEKYLSKTKLLLLCKFNPIQDFVKKVDLMFYQNLVHVLIPDVLRPIPSSLTQAIRTFAKGLESWLTSAMQGCPTEIMVIKVNAVSAFAQTLRRYTSLNHLAQAARAVLQNSVQINQMLTDLNRVDFHNVQEQASWVCQCDGNMVAKLEADFKNTLQQQNSLEQWANWLKSVVNNVLKPYHGTINFTKAARQLLLKWSFYSSMVIRDLTLRSAASFGSFHLIRLLYDEYMFYLIEHQVANATGEMPIAVIGDREELSLINNSINSQDIVNLGSSNTGNIRNLSSTSTATTVLVTNGHHLANDNTSLVDHQSSAKRLKI